MSNNNTVGYVTGTLSLKLGDDLPPIELGMITLPLKVKRLIRDTTNYADFGIGVDLDAVKHEIAAIFRNNEDEGEPR